MDRSPSWWPAARPRAHVPTGTINLRQVVAYNLNLARKQRGLTQRALGDALAQLTGRSWTVAAVSAAESIWDSPRPRPRSFDVVDLIAFSLALQVPVTWFLLPPPRMPDGTEAAPYVEYIELGKRLAPGDENPAVELMSPQFLADVVLSRSDLSTKTDLMSSRLESLPRSNHEEPLTADDELLGKRLLEALRQILKEQHPRGMKT